MSIGLLIGAVAGQEGEAVSPRLCFGSANAKPADNHVTLLSVSSLRPLG
jgi:hypothetical protein